MRETNMSHFRNISIIIPVKNESKHIKNCLVRIARQTYFNNILEILIIDGNSEDDTLSIVEAFRSEINNRKIKIVNDRNSQRSSGLNQGISQSKGAFVIRIDARAIIEEDYVERCVNTLQSTGADNVGGIQKALESTEFNAVQRAVGIAMSHPFGVGNAQFRIGKKSGPVDSVYLGCFRRELFNKVGLFDDESPVISEDSDFNFRIRRSGGVVYLDNSIIVNYAPRERIIDLARLYFRYGGARAGFMLKWNTYTAFRQLVPPLFIAMIVLLPFFSFFDPYCGYLWGAMLFAYGLVDLYVASRITLIKKCWHFLPLLLLIFPTLHFSWALGFWKRIFQGKNYSRYWGR